MFERADALPHEALGSPDPRRLDRETEKWGDLVLSMIALRAGGREAMKAKPACVRAVKLPSPSIEDSAS